MKSTLHDQKQSLGSSDYFERPIEGTVKAAVIMHKDAATLALLPNSFQIGDTLTAEQMKQILAMPATEAPLPYYELRG